MGTLLAVGLLCLVCLGACGSGSEDTPRASRARTLVEGRQRAREMVDRTLAEVAGGRKVSEVPPIGPGACDDPAGGPSALFHDDYEKEITIGDGSDADQLIRETRRYWEDQGYAVRVRDLDTRVPVVFAEVDGYNLSLQVVRDKSRASIGASTPCLPDR